MNDSTSITVYTPNERTKIGWIRSWVMMFKNIITYRELIKQLFRRDFFMAYKKSFIGFGWVIISPIMGIVSWVILNSTGILNPGDVGGSYIVFVLVNSSLWGLFMGFYSAASSTLDAGQGFINQVKYPHEVLLIKQAAQHLANFSITFIVNIVVLLISGIVPSWAIILFPILALPLFFLASGIGLVISVLNVVAPDFTKVFNYFLGFLFYVTPVIYSPSINNELLRKVVSLNPLTYLLTTLRESIVTGQFTNFDKYLLFSVLSIIIFFVSWRLFYISEQKVIERMI